MGARSAFTKVMRTPALLEEGGDTPYCYKCVVFDPQGRIPLFQRSKGFDRWFELPGGKKRFDETETQCVARELLEELGVHARFSNIIGAIHDPVFGTSDMVTFVHAHLISGTPRNILPDEHLSLHLCTSQEAVQKLGTRIPPEVAAFILQRPVVEYANLSSRRSDQRLPY